MNKFIKHFLKIDDTTLREICNKAHTGKTESDMLAYLIVCLRDFSIEQQKEILKLKIKLKQIEISKSFYESNDGGN